MSGSTQPLFLPRGLILLGSIWLIVSWMLSIGVQTPLRPSSASYTPGVAVMLLCVMIGLLIGWPLLRLSERPFAQPVRQVALDLLVLVALVQVVVWPLRLVTPWPPLRTAAVDATLAGWLLLVGAIVASAAGSARAGPRIAAMGACVLLCVAAPAAAMFGLAADSLGQVNPLAGLDRLTGGGAARPSGAEWRSVGLLAVVDLVAWGGLAAVNLARSRASGSR